jgi:hypothetical protein
MVEQLQEDFLCHVIFVRRHASGPAGRRTEEASGELPDPPAEDLPQETERLFIIPALEVRKSLAGVILLVRR